MIATFNGGPLNGYRLDAEQAGDVAAAQHEGRYVLDDGGYYWHVAEPADEAAPDGDEAAPDGAPNGTDAPRPRTRARRRPAQ